MSDPGQDERDALALDRLRTTADLMALQRQADALLAELPAGDALTRSIALQNQVHLATAAALSDITEHLASLEERLVEVLTRREGDSG